MLRAYINVTMFSFSKETEILKTIGKQNLGNRSQLTGSLPMDELAKIANQSQEFVLPSLTAESGDMADMPVSLVDAMACGMLTFSTYHRGMAELIDQRQDQLLILMRKPKPLAYDLNYTFIQLDAEGCQKLSLATSKEVEDQFNVTLLNSSLIQLLRC